MLKLVPNRATDCKPEVIKAPGITPSAKTQEAIIRMGGRYCLAAPVKTPARQPERRVNVLDQFKADLASGKIDRKPR